MIHSLSISESYLDAHLAACISFNEVNSMYWWEERLEQNSEIQLLIKSQIDLENKILDFIKSMHSYNTPELICIKGHASYEYIKWLKSVS